MFLEVPNTVWYAVDRMFGVDEYGEVHSIPCSISVAGEIFADRYIPAEKMEGFKFLEPANLSAEYRAVVCCGIRDRIVYNKKALRMNLQVLKVDSIEDFNLRTFKKELDEIEADESREDDRYYVKSSRDLIKYLELLCKALKTYSKK